MLIVVMFIPPFTTAIDRAVRRTSPGSALQGYDCIVALQAVRHIVAPPAHYAAKLNLPVLTGGENGGRWGLEMGVTTVISSIKP